MASLRLTSPALSVVDELPRPTPIYPVASESDFAATPTFAHATTSAEGTSTRPSVIRAGFAYSPECSSQLPTCSEPNVSQLVSTKAPSASKRLSYPREFKLLVVDYFYANGQNKYRTCKEFQITKSMLNGWLQKVDSIRRSRPGSLKSGRSGRKPQFPDVEQQLYDLYMSKMRVGTRVGNRWLRDTARFIAQEQCTEDQLTGMCQFSERWLSNFKKRYGIGTGKAPSVASSFSGDESHAEDNAASYGQNPIGSAFYGAP
ncbi:hypothetical protein AAVH_03995 [Aphelenchoides avenae]|nr:hypothetical protein AAVH_03995 [Aphelenchus avenae]